MFPIYFHFPVYFICHWKKFFLYNSPEFLKTFLGFFCSCQNVVQSNGTLIEILFFNFRIDTKKLWAEKFVGQAWEGLQNFARNMEGAIVLSTQCVNMMLLKMFNWYMFKIFCSSKIFLLCSNLFLLKIVRIAYFCWQLIFLKFDLQVLPQAILAQFM